MALKFTIVPCRSIHMRAENPYKVNMRVQPAVIVSDSEIYRGQYVVEPKFIAQTLETRQKLMEDNVTVEAIFVSRVSNPSGGKTIYIGGSISGQ